MLKFFKYLLLAAVLAVVLPVGYFAGPFVTETTPDNVEGRVGRICTAAAIGRGFESQVRGRRHRDDFSVSDCDCMAKEVVRTLTPAAATQIVEAFRNLVIDKVTGRTPDPGRKTVAIKQLDIIGPVLESGLRLCKAASGRT